MGDMAAMEEDNHDLEVSLENIKSQLQAQADDENRNTDGSNGSASSKRASKDRSEAVEDNAETETQAADDADAETTAADVTSAEATRPEGTLSAAQPAPEESTSRTTPEEKGAASAPPPKRSKNVTGKAAHAQDADAAAGASEDPILAMSET